MIFPEPIAFNDRRSFARVTFDIDRRRPRTLRFRTPDSGALHRISRLKDRDSRVED